MHTTQQARSYGRDFRPMPAATPDLQLEPLAPAKQGFAGRAPMVTAEQLRAVELPQISEAQALAADRAMNAAKASPEYFAPSDLFSLSQQNRGVL